jgi:hypothetical protein
MPCHCKAIDGMQIFAANFYYFLCLMPRGVTVCAEAFLQHFLASYTSRADN